VWRRIQVLGPLQSFALGSACAAVIALPLAVRSISHDDTALLRDLFWPHQLDPYIVFSLFFIGVLPVLLGYSIWDASVSFSASGWASLLRG